MLRSILTLGILGISLSLLSQKPISKHIDSLYKSVDNSDYKHPYQYHPADIYEEDDIMVLDDFSDDSLIEVDSSISREQFNTERSHLLDQLLDSFYEDIGIFDPDISQGELLDNIENYKNVELFIRAIKDLDQRTRELWEYNADFGDINYSALVENVETFKDYFNVLIREKYSFYGVTNTSKKAIKSVHAYHDNDVFMGPKNKDRDYTGGFRFEFTTDFLKLRLIKYAFAYDRILSYQSFFIGGEGYTPYIRYSTDQLEAENISFSFNETGTFFDADSERRVSKHMTSQQEISDRPFASFQYLGRGKYRMHYLGYFRSQSLFKIGYIGQNVGENIQAVLHQDFTSKSIRVLNWDRQIGNGGRLALNVYHDFDLMLFSKSPTLFNEKKDQFKAMNEGKGLADDFHVYIPMEFAAGFVHTHIGAGIGIRSQSFLQTSGLDDVSYSYRGLSDYYYGNRFFNWLSQVWRHSNVFAEYKCRHVIHNSMLEGFGFAGPLDDDILDDEAITVYALSEQDIAPWLHMLDFGINVRIKKMSLFYKQTRLVNREFEVKELMEHEYIDDFVPGNFQTERWYGWGTVGFNILL